MKTLAIALATAVVCFAASASAEIIGVETFDYPDGAIAGQNGGTFWDFKNTSPTQHTGTASTWDTVFGTAPAVASGRLVTSNGGAKREYNGANEGQGAVNDVNVNKTVYYRVTLTTGATLPDFFGLSSYDHGFERIFFGKRFGQPNFGLEVNGGAFANSTVAVQPNTTYTLVAAISYPGDTISLFINPDLNAGEPAVHATASWPNTEWSTALRLSSGNSTAPITWDNLVVATTWEELGTIVTTAADEDNLSLDPAAGGGSGVSLREAVKYSPSGTLVTFADALSGQTITLSGGELVPPGALTIDASSLPLGLTIDGNGASRLFRLDSARALTLHSLSLTGGNAGGDAGGAIANNGGKLRVRHCTFADNRAAHGGAIDTQAAFPAFTEVFSCTFTGNAASAGRGGAIRNVSGALSITASTISGNAATAGNGGGLASDGTTPAPFTSVTQSIVSGNAGDDVVFIGDASNVTSFGHNLIGNGNASPRFNQTGDQTGITNPKLSPLGYFGGPTQTMHPLIGSQAIDMGGAINPGGTDQRGFPRFVDGNNSSGAQLDIGAVEAGPLLLVTNAGDDTGLTLRFMLALASPPGARIGFDPGTFPATITLGGSGELTIPATRRIFIDASNLSGPVTISANNASRVFNILAGASVAMHNLVITGGRSADATDGGPSGADGANGGGILNGGSLSLLSCRVAANRTGSGGDGDSDGGKGGSGGGVFSSGRLQLAACEVSSNFTGNGGDASGAAGLGGSGGAGAGISASGALTITGCTIAGNRVGASGSGPLGFFSGDGGGVKASSVVIRSSTIAANHAGVGGGLFVTGALRLEHGTVASNSAGVGGGIFALLVTPVALRHSIVAGNTGVSGRDISQGTVTYHDANFIGSTSGISSATGPAPLTGNAKLMPLGNYGGPTQTMPPLAGSPAIDAGAATSPFATDQRGFPRVVDGNNSGSAQLDLGAVEAAFRFVMNANDVGPGSLRQTLADAAAAPGWEAIAFSSSLDGGTISLATDPTSAITALVIDDTDGVAIDASSLTAGLTITKPAGNYRLFRLNFNKRLSLHQLTLTGGSIPIDLGGAIANAGGTLSLSDCTLTGNTAQDGGAIYSESDFDPTGPFTEIRNCTITGNTATGQGGAIRNFFGRTAVLFSTITGNSAPIGGGIASYGNAFTFTEVTSSIISGNTGGDVVFTDDATNSFISRGHNLIGTGNATSAFNQTGDLVTTADPLLMPLDRYGGPTRTMPPMAGSPAIDAGSAPGVSHDQRGLPRNVDGNNTGGAQPDIGAVEAAFRFVLIFDNAGPGTLRQAIADAAAAPGFEGIAFASNLNGGTISLTSIDPLSSDTGLVITDADGVAIDATSLSGGLTITKPSGEYRLFSVFSGRLSLHQLTLTGGNLPSSPSSQGGAIRNFGTLLLTRCTLTGNAADEGGAIANVTGSDFTSSGTTLLHCTVSGNTAGEAGGGIFNDSGRTTLTHCTISANTAPADAGSGVAVNANGLARTEVKNTIIAGNTNSDADLVFGTLNNTFVSQGHNLIGTGNATAAFIEPGDTTGVTDPLLAPLGDYGGPTFTMALQPGSDARNNAAVILGVLRDQRGFPILGPPDIGAYEAGTHTHFNAYIWETLPANATEEEHDADHDYDGDGQTNFNEWLAGTDAASPASVFRLSSLAREGTNLRIHFPTVAGRNYELWFTDDLLGTWAPTNLPVFAGNGGTGFFDIPHPSTSGLPKRFYEVRLAP